MANSTGQSQRTDFKLTRTDGPTRRLSFPARPTWQELSGKVAQVYQLPVHDVALAYTDQDGDDITLNSDEELQLMYADLAPGALLKFDVRTLPGNAGPAPLQQVAAENEENDDWELTSHGAGDRGALHQALRAKQPRITIICYEQNPILVHQHA
jgi:hypothetical protein